VSSQDSSQSRVAPRAVLDGEPTSEALPFRVSLTLAARALGGIALALHRIADALEQREAK
jgi:hypothetical protein